MCYFSSVFQSRSSVIKLIRFVSNNFFWMAHVAQIDLWGLQNPKKITASLVYCFVYPFAKLNINFACQLSQIYEFYDFFFQMVVFLAYLKLKQMAYSIQWSSHALRDPLLDARNWLGFFFFVNSWKDETCLNFWYVIYTRVLCKSGDETQYNSQTSFIKGLYRCLEFLNRSMRRRHHFSHTFQTCTDKTVITKMQQKKEGTMWRTY